MITGIKDPGAVAPLVKNWRETMLWSYLEGRMGRAFTVEGRAVRSAMVCVGDMFFLAGEPDAALAAFLPAGHASHFAILMPQNAGWAHLVERVRPEARRITRYAFQKRNTFDLDSLRRMAVPPKGFELQPVEETLYHAARAAEWSRDLVSQYPSYADYAAHGRGFAATEGGEIVCGASSYTDWSGGIEIEVDCRPDRRRFGLARACAAALVLDCLARGLHPSWDAANGISAHLADTLGYEPAGAYPAFEVDVP